MPIPQTNRPRHKLGTWARLPAHQSPDLPVTDTRHPSPPPAGPLPILQMGQLSLLEEGEESVAIVNLELVLALDAEDPGPALGKGLWDGLVGPRPPPLHSCPEFFVGHSQQESRSEAAVEFDDGEAAKVVGKSPQVRLE